MELCNMICKVKFFFARDVRNAADRNWNAVWEVQPLGSSRQSRQAPALMASAEIIFEIDDRDGQSSACFSSLDPGVGSLEEATIIAA